MNQRTTVKRKFGSDNTSRLIQSILKEIRLLRREVTLLLPNEDLKEYVHPKRVINSYRKAVKKYPPAPVWK